MTPEERLLVACCAPPAALRRARAVPDAVTSNADWSFILRQAEALEVGPLVASAALAHYGNALPRAVTEQCRTSVYANVQRNVRLRSDLQRLVGILHTTGVTAVPFKGIVLAQRAFGGIAARRIGDLDLVVPSNQMAQASHALFAAGLRLAEASAIGPASRPRLDLVGEGWAVGHLQVELHQAGAFADYWRGDEQLLWREVQPDAEWGHTFSNELTLAHLALHWHQHKFDLRTLVDYAWTTQVLAATIAGARFRTLIGQLGLSTIVRMADLAAWRILGVALQPWACPSLAAPALSLLIPTPSLLRPRTRRDEDRLYLLQAATGPRTRRWLWRWLTLPAAQVRAHHQLPAAWPAWRVQASRFTRGLRRTLQH